MDLAARVTFQRRPMVRLDDFARHGFMDPIAWSVVRCKSQLREPSISARSQLAWRESHGTAISVYWPSFLTWLHWRRGDMPSRPRANGWNLSVSLWDGVIANSWARGRHPSHKTVSRRGRAASSGPPACRAGDGRLRCTRRCSGRVSPLIRTAGIGAATQLRNHVDTCPALRQAIIAYDQIRASVVLADASERRLIGICRQHVVTPTHQRFARGFEHKHIIVDDGDEPEPRCFGGCFR